MACNSHLVRNFFCPSVLSTSPRSASFAFPGKFARLLNLRSTPLRIVAFASSLSSISGTPTFSWGDVFQASQPEIFTNDDSSDLEGYFDKVNICNRNSKMQSEFLPFILQNVVVGYIHKGFAEHLKQFRDVFVFSYETNSSLSSHVTLHPLLGTPEDRTRALGDVISCLGEEHIPGIRNELFSVTSSFGAPIFFSLERAAAPYFGIKAYGVHMNGYVEKGSDKFLWIGKRSATKQTYPGMLDHLVGGGLSHGIACGENLMKECEEEAGIPRSLSKAALSVGAVSYVDIERFRYKRDVLFCYDLKLPESFKPENQDGEVEEFKLMPITDVANVIRRTHFFKPNCSLVIMDFLFRHGYIKPDCFGYLNLLQSLRSGSCS